MVAKLFQWYFKMKGWKIEGEIPSDVKKCVIIGAPHTSNWDFVYGIGALECFKMKVQFLAKKELFKFPLKNMFLKLGGIPVDRTKNQSLVDAMIDVFNRHPELKIIIPTEGTRKRVEKWKSGFYHLALGAKIPVALGFLDYKRKKAGFGPTVMLTGEIERDMDAIRAFYQNITGKIPENFNVDAIRIS
ncbi:lysophospholipid acyltransferase family protein [bacterium]|nr:lysophospholipid acyltransferase family protein [bacterium]